LPGNHALAFTFKSKPGFGIGNPLGVPSSAFGACQNDDACVEVDISRHIAPPLAALNHRVVNLQQPFLVKI
jgi:hypothetical protein